MKKACALLLALAMVSAWALAGCGRGLDDEPPLGGVIDKSGWVKNSATPAVGGMTSTVPTFAFTDVLGADATADSKTGN